MSTLTVELGERSYPILIQPELLKQPQAIIPYLTSKKAVIVTNDVVGPLYLDALKSCLEGIELHVIQIKDGEAQKNLSTFADVITGLLEIHAARDTTLIALGGGVVGDLTGFVAASFQRGMPFIQVPTTLLSQVDSSVGGKTAVNHPLGKNMIGAFYQPKAVIIDTTTLSTLPEREFAAGMAEVIKYGIIYDKAFFSWLEENADALKAKSSEQLQYAIHRCCEIKAEIVAKDEKESGIRALLNLGHTFGHAIEAEQGYGQWLHGEAVAAGMVLAGRTSVLKNWLSTSELRRIEALLSAFSLPIAGPQKMDTHAYVKHMQHDKKVQDGNIRFVLPKGIGHAVVSKDVDNPMLRQVIQQQQ